MTPDEISKLTKYFHRVFKQPDIQLRQRPQKDDSCEVYVGEEFIGVVFRDDEDPDDPLPPHRLVEQDREQHP